MEKITIKRKRPKAFIGAIIGAVGSIASGVMGGIQAKKEAKEQAYQQELTNKKQEAANLTQAYSGSVEADETFKNRFRTEFAKGGKRKCAKGGVEPIITEGGNGIKVNDSLTLLRGRKHKTGGIVIGKGRNSIEAESGEVIKTGNNQMKIFSAEPILKGKSPATKVLENPNKADKVFQEQETYKDKNNLNDDGTKRYKCGGKKKAKLGLEKGLGIGADVIGAAAPIVSGIISRNAINKIKAPKKPAEYTAAKLKTDYNINPQLSELERTRQIISSDIDANTASSVAGLARKQRINTDIGMQKNILYGQKENIETDLINKSALNRQQVSAQNISQSNEYNRSINQLDTEKRLAKADITTQIIEGTTGALRDYQSRKDRQKQEKSALSATMAQNPEQVDLFIKKKKQYESYLSGNSFKCGGKRKMKKK